MSFFLFSCAQSGTVDKAITSVGNNGDIGSGITNNAAIAVVSGKIVVNTVSGKMVINSADVTLVTLVDNIWQLANGTTITLTDNKGNVITFTIVIDQLTSAISLIPNEPLDSSLTYTLTITALVNGVPTTYNITVIISVDNLNQPNSFFAAIPTHNTAGTFNIKDMIGANGKIYFGWQFPPRFVISLSNLEGAHADLTFYGTYSGLLYEDLVMYQRWINTGIPVKDYIWTGSGISVDETDSTISTPTGFLSFSKTYLEMTIIDSTGKDVTASSNAVIHISIY